MRAHFDVNDEEFRMNPRQMTLIDSSRATLLLQSAAGPAPDDAELARFVEAICVQGDCLHLRPQQRVPLPPAGKVAVLRQGMLAIDAMPAKGKLQVLDFLVAGDVVSASTVLPTPGVSLRAITSASLVSLDPPAVNRAVAAHDYWKFLIAQCLNQLARVNIHQLMIGRLETEPRVASFVLGLALRNVRADTPEISVALPMSRTDIANYLVINCDTLSRTMMRFCDCGLIERESRHAIRVTDLDALRKKSPLASLLSAVFEKGSGRQETSFGPDAERNACMPSVRESNGVIPSAVTTGSLSRSSATRGGW
jgi:CRP/FNR family transcriptional regulator, anaerobic regulatory protein